MINRSFARLYRADGITLGSASEAPRNSELGDRVAVLTVVAVAFCTVVAVAFSRCSYIISSAPVVKRALTLPLDTRRPRVVWP